MDSRCLELEELDGDGNAIDSFFPETLYRASKISGLSLNALRNARDKGNRLLVRRRDKKQFRITWCTSHDACFKARRERKRRRTKEGFRRMAREVKKTTIFLETIRRRKKGNGIDKRRIMTSWKS